MVGRANGSSWRERAGFTLIELLIALVIIGIIAAVAIPSYTSKVRQGRQANAERILTSLAQTAEIYRFQNENYTGMTIAGLQNLGWVDDSDKNPAGAQWYPTASVTIVSTGINPPNAPPDNSGALGPWFKAQAQGNIGGAQTDIWTVTNNTSPTNTQQGY